MNFLLGLRFQADNRIDQGADIAAVVELAVQIVQTVTVFCPVHQIINGYLKEIR